MLSLLHMGQTCHILRNLSATSTAKICEKTEAAISNVCLSVAAAYLLS